MSTQPYSGTNPIPKISDFVRENAARVEGLSDEKEIEEKANTTSMRKSVLGSRGPKGGNKRTVTDPTTGNTVEIEDANQEFIEEARKNDVVVPNANLPDRKEKGDQVGHSQYYYFVAIFRSNNLLRLALLQNMNNN